MGLFVVKIKRKRLQIKCVPKNFGAKDGEVRGDIVALSRDKLYNVLERLFERRARKQILSIKINNRRAEVRMSL